MGTNFEDCVMARIRAYALNFESIMAAAKSLGVRYETFKSWYDGKKSPTIKSLSLYAKQLGLKLDSPVSVMQRALPYAPVEKVEGENLPKVPVMGATGAGNSVELFSTKPEFLLPVLPRYYRTGLIGLVVDGDSMEPTIRKGAIVGIIPYDGTINEGGIYLVQRPPFGRTIKRIRMGKDNNLELLSDNPSYAPIPLPFEGYDAIIAGRVIWIWQSC